MFLPLKFFSSYVVVTAFALGVCSLYYYTHVRYNYQENYRKRKSELLATFKYGMKPSAKLRHTLFQKQGSIFALISPKLGSHL